MRIVPVLALTLVALSLASPFPAAAQVAPVPVPAISVPTPYSPFEVYPLGWNPGAHGVAVSVLGGSTVPSGYADGIGSKSLLFHGRLKVTNGCIRDCQGPSTSWLRPASQLLWLPTGHVTEVSVYLDTAWAAAHPDVRFDWSSAIARSDGMHLRDFVFNAGTDPAGAPRFVVSASTNAFRHSSYPSNPDKQPQYIAASGWYTFRHVFQDDGGVLVVDMSIRDAAGNVVASWTRTNDDPIAGVGGALYGWFANQEVPDLAVDDGWWLPCLPLPSVALPAPVGVSVPSCA